MATSEPTRGLTRHEADAPWLEPVDAYRALRDAGHEPQLLDGLGLHPEARHACVALAPAVRLTVRDGALTAHHGGGTETDRDVLGALRRWTDRFRFDGFEPGVFTGGWVGVFGYEFVRTIEPTLPAHAARTPDAWLWLCRDAVVFDRVAQTVRVLAHDLPGETGAADRLAAYSALLVTVQPRPPAPSTPGEVAWETSLDQPGFEAATRRVRDLIAAGDLFQANVATRFQAPCADDPVDLFARLAAANPSPYMALLSDGDHTVVSCSPEQLFATQSGILRARPIAGTRPRGADADSDAAHEADLLGDAKERAEHTMLVDLLRNDVARACVPGTVHVPECMSVERYRHVMHLVSRVEGRLRPGTGFVDWLCALFPGGTITGAPKHRACLRIHEAEPVARGPYTGSAGYVSWSGDAHWNILIRTLVLQEGVATVHAGSGIVADSDPAREWHEAGHKAQALLEAATGGDRGGGNPDRVGEVTRHGSWRPPALPGTVAGRRVLLIDNYDSFTYNLADHLAALGAEVQVVRNDEDWLGALAALGATHVVLSPGPGRPEDSRATLEVARAAARGDLGLPVLGVCLGHQALGLAAGGIVDVGEPVHGKAGSVRHEGGRLLRGLESPMTVGRYHSLVVRPGSLGGDWRETAWLSDGTMMALEHASRPIFGLQFHPESISTGLGLEILLRFLET